MRELLDLAHAHAAAAARGDFIAFLAYVGIDERGQPFGRRELDRFVWSFAEECFETSTPCCLMLPMGSGKTTLACFRAAYELGQDPNLLVSVVSYSQDRACELVDLVRNIIQLPSYARVFPDIRICDRRDKADRFFVERTGVSNNPSVGGFGIQTGTGTRTNFLILDDICTTKNSILEPTSRANVRTALRMNWMSRQQLRGGTKRRIIWLQTAYHEQDASAVLRKEATSGWRFLIVRAEEPYETLGWEKWERGAHAEFGTVASPFPASILRDRAAQMGPTAAARGLANRPVSAAMCPFKEEHFEGPEPRALHHYDRRILFADPAGDATRLKTGDPDWCAIVVIGLYPEEKCWDVICADRMRGAPSAQARFIAGRAIAWKVNSVYQEATKDEALVEVTQNALRDAGCYIGVTPEKPTVNKEIRITQTLEPALSVHPPLLRVCGRRFPELRDEALTFPAAAHDDLLDALAGAFAKTANIRRRPYRSPRDPDWQSPIDKALEGITLRNPPDDMLTGSPFP